MASDNPKEQSPVLSVEGDLRLAGGLNERMFRLLHAIEQLGSINRAAKHEGLSYKGAWEMIERANNVAPCRLVETAIGGLRTSGTRLTTEGRHLLALHHRLLADHAQFLAKINREISNDPILQSIFRRTGMKASARNQLFGIIDTVNQGATYAEVIIKLKGGDTLVASVTVESAQVLGMKPGMEVVGLIKAPMVTLVTEFGGYKLSARNQLAGTISRIEKGVVNSDVVLELKGGDTIAATVTNPSLETMGISVGASATAVFKAGAVIIGVPA